MLLTITASPGVRALNITADDKLLAVHFYRKETYMALVAKGREEPINDEELKKAAMLMGKLMDKLARELDSRYYTFTGPLEMHGEVIVYKPYVTPTSTALIELRGKTARVSAGDYRRKFRASVDLTAILRRYVEILKYNLKYK